MLFQSTQLGINAPFPTNTLFIRNVQEKTTLRSIYLSNELVKAVLTANEPSRHRCISAGIKIIGRQETGSRDAPGGKATLFRVLSDGVESVLPFMNQEDIISAGIPELRTFLEHPYPLVSAFNEKFKDAVDSRGKIAAVRAWAAMD